MRAEIQLSVLMEINLSKLLIRYSNFLQSLKFTPQFVKPGSGSTSRKAGGSAKNDCVSTALI